MSVKKIPLKEISLDTVFDSSQDEEEYGKNGRIRYYIRDL